MIQNWAGYEGRLAGTWRLDSFLGDREGKGFYMSTNPADSSPALVELIAADSEQAASVRGGWERARSFTHDSLLRVYETGQTELDYAPVLYAVLPLPDDDVGEILANRPLDSKEARAMVSAAAGALEFLHKRDLRHGALTPSNVFLVNGAYKLGVDAIAPAEGTGRHSDIRQLGATLAQSLTRNPDPAAATQLPSPFREIAAGCFQPPVSQWTAARIREAVSERTAAAPQPSRSRLRFSVIGLATLAIASVAGYLLIHKAPDPVEPVPKKVEQPVATPPPPPAALKPSPLTPARPPAVERRKAEVRGGGSATWAVIAATYNGYAAAQHRADQLAKLSPKLRTHVYPPQGEGQTYYVVLGSGLTQEEANSLRDHARQSGAPRDSYVTKLNDR